MWYSCQRANICFFTIYVFYQSIATKLRKDSLREFLRKHNMYITGTKAELLSRVKEVIDRSQDLNKLRDKLMHRMMDANFHHYTRYNPLRIITYMSVSLDILYSIELACCICISLSNYISGVCNCENDLSFSLCNHLYSHCSA